jgi:hypothetical protein
MEKNFKRHYIRYSSSKILVTSLRMYSICEINLPNLNIRGGAAVRASEK